MAELGCPDLAAAVVADDCVAVPVFSTNLWAVEMLPLYVLNGRRNF